MDGFLSYWLRKFSNLFESEIEALHFADKITVLSENMKRNLLEVCPFDIKKGDIVLLYLGRTDPMKGLEYLINSMYYI